MGNEEIPLSDDLLYWRAERPDEWIMDRFIRKAKELEASGEKVARLEGWLKYLWVLYWQEHDGELLGAVENKEIDAEISDYIKAMEGKP